MDECYLELRHVIALRVALCSSLPGIDTCVGPAAELSPPSPAPLEALEVWMMGFSAAMAVLKVYGFCRLWSSWGRGSVASGTARLCSWTMCKDQGGGLTALVATERSA